MLTHKYSRFISRKIKNLRTAIFFDDSPAILKIPTSIITVSDIDKTGNIWFSVRKPYQDISGLESRFFSKLQFYNKMCNYFIIIHGHAIIVTDKNALPDRDFSKSIADENEILLKIAISDAEFHCARTKKGPGLFSLINKLLMKISPSYRERKPLSVSFNI
jgi:general stress protein 26